MGAGRTELARSLFGRSYGRYLGGQVVINGKPVQLATVQQAIDHKIAYVPEDRKALGLNLLDTIQDTIVSADLAKIARRGVVDADAAYLAAEEYRSSLRIKANSVREGVVKLSGGNQQKVLLGKWMFTEPELLILDEPTRGIDVGAKYEIYGLVQRLADAGQGRDRDLLRAARAARSVRPDLHDLRRHDHRRARPGGRHAGEPHAAHDGRGTGRGPLTTETR